MLLLLKIKVKLFRLCKTWNETIPLILFFGETVMENDAGGSHQSRELYRQEGQADFHPGMKVCHVEGHRGVSDSEGGVGE
jgi:hypothetical protein